MVSLVRAACLTNFRQVASASGLNPDRMLLDVDLSPAVLDEPDRLIPADKVGQLLQNAASQSGNECFGICMASNRLLSNLGPVGLLIRDQATLRESLHLLVRHLAALNSALTLSVEENGNSALIRSHLLSDNAGTPVRQRVELTHGVIVQAIRQLVGHGWRPARVCFEHGAPQNMALHTRMFGPNLNFNQEINCIICTRADLDARNDFADPAMARYTQKLLEPMAQAMNSGMLEDVRRAILMLLPNGQCSIEQVSEYMGVVPRTVQRRLTERGHTFSATVNDIRRQLAIRYVRESKRPLTEISDLLGFTAASSFSRWYQVQFGCSAKQSRGQSQMAAA